VNENTESLILELLSHLYLAYPQKEQQESTLQLYLKMLADIPIWLLELAIEQIIHTSPFFPKISEIRQVTAQIAGTQRFDQLPREPVDRLAFLAQSLEDDFYHAGRLDPAEWQALAEAFTLADRPHRAEHTLEKLRRLQQIQAKRRPAPAPEPESVPVVLESLPVIPELAPVDSAASDFAAIDAVPTTKRNHQHQPTSDLSQLLTP
jgi:hypothetical protein